MKAQRGSRGGVVLSIQNSTLEVGGWYWRRVGRLLPAKSRATPRTKGCAGLDGRINLVPTGVAHRPASSE